MTQLKANSVYFNSASNAWMPMPPPHNKRHGLNSEAQATRAVGHQTRKRAVQNYFKKRMHPYSKTKARLSSGQTHSNYDPLPLPAQLPQPWTNANVNDDVFTTHCYHPASHHTDKLLKEFFTCAYPNDHDITKHHVKEKKQINPAIPHPNPPTTPNSNDAPPRLCYPPKPWEQAMMSLDEKTVTQMLEFALHTSPFHYPHNGMPTFAVMAHITAQLRRNVHEGQLHELTHQDAPMKEGNNAVTMDFTTLALDWLDTKELQNALSKHDTPPSAHLTGMTPQQPKHPTAASSEDSLALLDTKHIDNAELRFRSVLKVGTMTQNHSDLGSTHQPNLTCKCQTFPMQCETFFPAIDNEAHVVTSQPDIMNTFTAFPQSVRASLIAKLDLGPCLD